MRYTFILFVLIINGFLNGQNFSSIRYTMDNGLPQNSVKDIVKDKYGFIWITTENNVLKYDGKTLETYKNSSLSNSHLGDFYGNIQKDSIIVFGDLHGKKLILKDRKLEKLVNNQIKRTTNNKKGDSFSIFNKTTSEGLYYNNNPGYYYIDLDREKYFFTNGYQIDYEKDHKSKTLSIPYLNLRNTFAIGETIFIRNLEKKKLYALEKGTKIEVSAPNIFFDHDTKIHWQQTTGQVFLIKNNQLYLGSFTNKKLTFKLLVIHNDIKKPFHCIFYDKDYNKIYLGSLTKGLQILAPYAFRNTPDDYVAYASLPYNESTFILPDGRQLGKNGLIQDFNFRNQEVNTFLMVYDNKENIVYSKERSLVKLLKSQQYKKHEEIVYGRSKIKMLRKIRDVYFVAVTDDENQNILYLYDNDLFQKPIHTLKFKREVTSLSAYGKNEILVGTTDELFILSLDDLKVKTIYNKICVKHIIQNNDGTHWITTKGQGFFLLKSSKLIAFPVDRDNALLSAHYLLEDRNGYLWISSNNGLFKVSKTDVKNYLENKDNNLNYYRYDTENGLLNNELNGGSFPNAYQLENKDFIFPSFNGFIIFNPVEIQSFYPKKKDLVVERVRINNGDIEYFNDNISVQSNFQQLEFLLDIPYYDNEKNLQISIKQDNQPYWKDIKNQRKFDIFNLKPGSYKFTIRVYTGSGYDYKTINLEVVPFFYQTKLFYFFLFLIITSIIVWIIYFRTKDLSGKNTKLKKQLASESDYQKKLMETISHDITTPLKFISDLSQKIMESDNPDIQRQYFDSIHKSSEELYKFTSDMKNYADLFKDIDNYEICSIFDIIEEKKLLFHEIAKQKNIIIYNNISPSLSLRTKKNFLVVIIHNILDNAIKNSKNSKIEINYDISISQDITIAIIDYGSGMNKDQIVYYNSLANSTTNNSLSFKSLRLGLNLVIHLIKKIDSKILFCNNIPTGTIVKITLKTNLNEKNPNN